ncbi:MAG: flagellar FlbD family protein [Acidobacteria bacterium]|nr:flagellar FlbD family protein [Acidobacteriota bacterium]
MIPVTRLDGTPMIVNTEQVAWIEYVPDTVIALMNGEKLIVRESPETIVERVRDFKRAVSSGGRVLSHPALGVVEPAAKGEEW